MAVLPAAVERLLKHWKTLDKAVGPGNGLFETLRSLLQVRVSTDSSTGDGVADIVDLCQWILSQSLSSQEALSRPFLPRASGGLSSTATGRIGNSMRRPQNRDRGPPSLPDDELTGRVIRAYRSFANAGLFGTIGGDSGASDGGALRLATGLWSIILRLPDGLRPASELRAKTALRLSIDLGLPTTTGTIAASSSAASILTSVLDVRPAVRTVAGGMGATRGALFYRRFCEPVHEALLKRGAECPWPSVCRSLVDACLSVKKGMDGHLLATQAFSVLEGVLTHQSEQHRVGEVILPSSILVMDPSETLTTIVPEFRRLVDDAEWGPPPPQTTVHGAAGDVAIVGTGRMLRESLRLCHRLLRLAAALESGSLAANKTIGEPSKCSSCFHQLLEMSTVLVAGTLGSAFAVVGASAKADALTLVPFLRPCLTRKARDYGKSVPHAGGVAEDQEGAVLPALEEMMSRHFPIEDSREPEEGSEQATAYAQLLRGLLAAFVRCGDLGLLKLLFGTLAEGRKHLHYR